MAEDDEGRERLDLHQYDVGRLLALSDGVFAIAMTLLVLGIPVPRVQDTNAALLAALNRIQGNLESFALSFALVGVYWVAHRRLLRGVVRTDTLFVWLNLLMLLLVCLVPFTAGLLSRYGTLATAVIIYAANLGLLGFLAFVLRVLSWRGRLVSVRPSRDDRRAVAIGSLLPTGVFAISIPIALWRPDVAEYTWLSLPVVGVAWRRLRRLLPGQRSPEDHDGLLS
jgi:uncharacterized membrane protein